MNGMGNTWRLESWGVLRVAGLAASVLPKLRLRGSPDVERALAAVEGKLERARSDATTFMFDLIRGCTDVDRRRAALDAKRRLFNGRPLSVCILERLTSGLPTDARSALTQVVALEEQHRVLCERFERTLVCERAAVSEMFRTVLKTPRLLGGILLSGHDHLDTARKLAAIPAGATLTSSQQMREATVARYVFRAAARTTPFSGFAATALVQLGTAAHPVSDAPPATHAISPHVVWRSAPQ